MSCKIDAGKRDGDDMSVFVYRASGEQVSILHRHTRVILASTIHLHSPSMLCNAFCPAAVARARVAGSMKLDIVSKLHSAQMRAIGQVLSIDARRKRCK